MQKIQSSKFFYFWGYVCGDVCVRFLRLRFWRVDYINGFHNNPIEVTENVSRIWKTIDILNSTETPM